MGVDAVAGGTGSPHWATAATAPVFPYYVRLSLPLAFGMLPFMAAVVAMLAWQDRVCPFAIGKGSLILFVPAWIGQPGGHKTGGKKPSFFKDVQSLPTGPAWLMHSVHRRLGIGY